MTRNLHAMGAVSEILGEIFILRWLLHPLRGMAHRDMINGYSFPTLLRIRATHQPNAKHQPAHTEQRPTRHVIVVGHHPSLTYSPKPPLQRNAVRSGALEILGQHGPHPDSLHNAALIIATKLSSAPEPVALSLGLAWAQASTSSPQRVTGISGDVLADPIAIFTFVTDFGKGGYDACIT